MAGFPYNFLLREFKILQERQLLPARCYFSGRQVGGLVTTMEQQGFIHDMMDVKVLILYTMARLDCPADVQQIYELCYQDDCLSYFDLREALPQMVESGHLEMDGDGKYTITGKGREAGAVLEDSLAVPVARRVREAAARFNDQARRNSRIHTVVKTSGDDISVALELDGEGRSIMRLELAAPSAPQARRLAAALRSRAEEVYQTVMRLLLEEVERKKKE